MSKLGQFLSKSIFRGKFTAYDQYVSIYKQPINSKIVIYGAYNELFVHLLRTQFKHARRISLDHLNLGNSPNDDELVKAVADNMLSIDETFSDACFIQDFPKNPIQAEKLDGILDGINLAVSLQLPTEIIPKLKGNYWECQACGQLFNSELNSTLPEQPGTVVKCDTPDKCSLAEVNKDLTKLEESYEQVYKPVFDYYEKRGLLLRFIVEEHWNFNETLERLREEITANVKL